MPPGYLKDAADKLRTFKTADEMYAFYRELLARRKTLRSPPPKPPPPPPMKEPPPPPEASPPLVPAPQRTMMQRIVLAITVEFGITPTALKSNSHRWQITIPRQCAMCLAKEFTQLSLPQIARAFGRCNHTTALHALRAFPKRMQNDADLAEHFRRSRIRVLEMIANEIRKDRCLDAPGRAD